MNTEFGEDSSPKPLPAIKDKYDGRKHRRRAPPRKPRPNTSEAMKRRWQDPEYRQLMEEHAAARRADPTKAWSRKGIPDGFTRETAAVMWAEAEAKARKLMHALKEKGLF